MSTAVIIVTYNRWAYLQAGLRALGPQLSPDDNIIVVDNGSTDGTRENVATEFPSVQLIKSTSNIGGAGGFALGLDVALSRHFTHAWLMDDDGEPAPDAYATLMEAARSLPNAAFWASTTWFYHGTVEDARSGLGLTPAIPGSGDAEYVTYTHKATFVGLLINLNVARRQALPLSDFFIWHDDSEYTARLSRERPGVRVSASQIIHPFKEEYLDFGERLRYDIRNRLWILRNRALGAPWLRREQLRAVPRTIASQALRSRNKATYFRALASGLKQGLLQRPNVDHPGSLVKRWDASLTSEEGLES